MAKTKTAKSTSAATKKSTPKAKAAGAKRKSDNPAEKEATVDRRRSGRRAKATAEKPAAEEAPKLERRKKVNRRRQIDPTTCERDYSDAEVEFMNALDEYKRTSGRMFPTCSEVLEVIRGLGYVQLSRAEMAARQRDDESVESQAEAEATEALEESAELHAEADALVTA